MRSNLLLSRRSLASLSVAITAFNCSLKTFVAGLGHSPFKALSAGPGVCHPPSGLTIDHHGAAPATSGSTPPPDILNSDVDATGSIVADLRRNRTRISGARKHLRDSHVGVQSGVGPACSAHRVDHIPVPTISAGNSLNSSAFNNTVPE